MDEIVSEFVMQTCERRRKINQTTIKSFFCCTGHISDNTKRYDRCCSNISVESYVLSLDVFCSGSMEEFNIQPAIPCIGDMDIMYSTEGSLALPSGAQIPDEIISRCRHFDIVLYELIPDVLYPGYVYPRDLGCLTWSSDDKRYLFRCSTTNHVLNFNEVARHNTEPLHGPALLNTDIAPGIEPPIDRVFCLPCPLWPPQADEWPRRVRKYGWPEASVVEEVVQRGCHVVGATHRHCERTGEQWRLSFSRAEVLLINSWSRVQQIVYHMLRFVVKNELLVETQSTDGTEKTLCNYHIKTLMLWACEEKLPEWWNASRLVHVCRELLGELAEWLDRRDCPNYFIPNCNLFDPETNRDRVNETLQLVDNLKHEETLCQWFLQNYIYRYVKESCVVYVRLKNRPKNASVNEIKDAVKKCIAHRKEYPIDYQDLARLLAWLQSLTFSLHFCWSSNKESYVIVKALSKLDDSLRPFFTATFLLEVISDIDYNHCEPINMIAFNSLAILYTGSLLIDDPSGNLKKASEFLALAVNLLTSDRRILLELAKVCLFKVVRYRQYTTESMMESYKSVANVYLAIIFYVSGYYGRSINHCEMACRTHPQYGENLYADHGELLSELFNECDIAVGFSYLIQYLSKPVTLQSLKAVFRPDLFAHYVTLKCLARAESKQAGQLLDKSDELKRYTNRVFHCDQASVYDVAIYFICLQRVISKGLLEVKYANSKPLSGDDDSSQPLSIRLMRSSVDLLTEFHRYLKSVCGHQFRIATLHYQALYYFKTRKYQMTIELCDRILDNVEDGEDDVVLFVIPPFLVLLDDDMTSVRGLMCLIYGKASTKTSDIFVRPAFLAIYLKMQVFLTAKIESIEDVLEHMDDLNNLFCQLSDATELTNLERYIFVLLKMKCNRFRQRLSERKRVSNARHFIQSESN